MGPFIYNIQTLQLVIAKQFLLRTVIKIFPSLFPGVIRSYSSLNSDSYHFYIREIFIRSCNREVDGSNP